MTDPKYPRGKINPHDEGELGLRIFIDDATSTVIVDFSKPVIWVGFSAADARHIAAMLVQQAERIEQRERLPKAEA